MNEYKCLRNACHMYVYAARARCPATRAQWPQSRARCPNCTSAQDGRGRRGHRLTALGPVVFEPPDRAPTHARGRRRVRRLPVGVDVREAGLRCPLLADSEQDAAHPALARDVPAQAPVHVAGLAASGHPDAPLEVAARLSA